MLSSHIKGSESEARVNEGVTNDLLCTKVFHNGAVKPALTNTEMDNVADPGDIRFVKGEATHKEVGHDGMRVL